MKGCSLTAPSSGQLTELHVMPAGTFIETCCKRIEITTFRSFDTLYLLFELMMNSHLTGEHSVILGFYLNVGPQIKH